MRPVDPIRIVLVEDHTLFAESLEMTLHLEGFDACRTVLGDEPSSARLLAAVLRLRPDVVLLDLDLGIHGNGLELIRPLSAARVAVVVVTSTIDRARWGECVASGARKVIPKSAPLSEIIAGVRRIANGLPMLLPTERQELIDCWRQRLAEEREIRMHLDRLTRREAEVLGLLMAGKQVSEIARERFVSESTVRTQVKAILAKLHVGSQLTAVGLAHRAHWSPPHDDLPDDPRQHPDRGSSVLPARRAAAQPPRIPSPRSPGMVARPSRARTIT